MSIRTLLVVGTAVAALALPAAAQAGATPSPGCKGVTNALAKADFSKGKSALTVVAEKLGCTTTVTPPPDPMACTAGSEIASWTSTVWDTRIEYGYLNRYVNWTKTGGSGDARPTYAETDAGGYWESSTAVAGWMMQSNSGEVIWVANPTDDARFTPTSGLFNQNSFVDRTGILLVRFCG